MHVQCEMKEIILAYPWINIHMYLLRVKIICNSFEQSCKENKASYLLLSSESLMKLKNVNHFAGWFSFQRGISWIWLWNISKMHFVSC